MYVCIYVCERHNTCMYMLILQGCADALYMLILQESRPVTDTQAARVGVDDPDFRSDAPHSTLFSAGRARADEALAQGRPACLLPHPGPKPTPRLN